MTSIKLQAAYTRQTELDNDPSKDGTSTASRILASDSLEKYGTLPIQIQYGKILVKIRFTVALKYYIKPHDVGNGGIILNNENYVNPQGVPGGW